MKKYSLNLKRNIIIITFLIFLVLIFYAFFLRFPKSSPEQNEQKDLRDSHGCLINQGYSYNDSFNLCVKEQELDKTTRQILELSKEFIAPDYGLTFINLSEEQCEGCFTIVLATKVGPRTIDITLNNPQLLKYFCSEESRNVDFCATLYDPVCGYPIKETFSNSCLACLNKKVEYYTKGECQNL